MKSAILRLAAAFALSLAFACSSDDPPGDVAVTGVKAIQPASVTIGLNGTATLTTGVEPDGATNKGINWTLSDNTAGVTIAPASGNSTVVTAHGTAGTATVTAASAADPTLAATRTVTVDASIVGVTGLTISPASMSLAVGAGQTLTGTVAPPNATDRRLTAISNATGTATVGDYNEALGQFTVRGVAPGGATITVATQDGNITRTCQVTVTGGSGAVPVDSVAISPKPLAVNVGANAALTAAIQPPNATNQAVDWASDNTAVATVTYTGLSASVRGVTAGTANIKVTTQDGGKTDTCRVTVAAPVAVAGLKLPAALTVRSAGGTTKLTADIWPWNASNRAVNWTTSNAAVAAVTTGGTVATVTGGTAGTATITATSAQTPTATATCTVTVAASLYQEVYMGGDYGMTKNVQIDRAYDYCEIRSIFVDPAGVVYAAGYDYSGSSYVPVYFRDGVRTSLPFTAGTNGLGNAIYVSCDNHVYVAGYEMGSTAVTAKLWVDGVNTPLAGASEYEYVQAMGVHAAGGNVYVVGVQSADGVSYAPACLWINQQGSATYAKTAFDALTYSAMSVAALGSDVYLGGGFGVIRLNPAAPTGYTVMPGYASAMNNWGSEVVSLRLVGEDLYASGWVEADPVIWKNHARTVLPWNESIYEWCEATDISVGKDGATYVSGRVDYYYGSLELQLPVYWKNNVEQALGGLYNMIGSPYAIGVKEAAVVNVTGVTMNAGTLSVPVGFTGTLGASVAPADAFNKALIWTSSNETVATVTGTGDTVTINGLTEGASTITARSEDNPSASATCAVSVVTVPIAGVSLPATATAALNRTTNLVATVTPATATDTRASWTSSNTAVATVAGAGLVARVTGLAEGQTTITVTTLDGNKTNTCLVTVAQSSVKAVSAAFSGGYRHSLAIKEDGGLWAWGSNDYGQLGDGTDAPQRTLPVRVGTDNGWTAVSAGWYTSLALKADGSLWAWGQNTYGQLGLGDTVDRNAPARVGEDSDWEAVSASFGEQSMAIKSDGSLWAWGWNGNGSLGLGDTVDRNAPTRVGTDNDWAAMSLGASSMALKADGRLWGWGHNYFGQLGLGDTTSRNAPVPVGTANDWDSVSAGGSHTLAVKTDGSLWVCGLNDEGMLGIGNTQNQRTLVPVAAAAAWATVAGGSYHSLGVQTDGSLWGWGFNASGQAGVGDTANRNAPARVGAATTWAAVAGGSYHSLGVQADGSLWAWGRNENGRLGVGDTADRHAPALVGTGFRVPAN